MTDRDEAEGAAEKTPPSECSPGGRMPAYVEAYKCSGKNMAELVGNLRAAGVFWSKRVEKAMLEVDRRHFVKFIDFAWADAPHPMGETTASAPHLHAAALQVLEPKLVDGCRALDIGCGCGYLAAAFSHLVAPLGRVWGVDISPELLVLSESNCKKGVPASAGVCCWKLAGQQLGLPKHGPFDAIHVGTGCSEMPLELLEQLAPGGRMVIPVGEQLLQVDKTSDGSGEVSTTPVYSGVQFTPIQQL